MATASTLKFAPVPDQQPTPSPVTRGKFTFEVIRGLAPPEVIPESARGTELPFKDMFSGMIHNDHHFIPQEFWTAPKEEGGRGIDPAKVTITYQKDKVRGAFKDWVSKDEAARGKWKLILVPRKGGEIEGITGPGLSFFFVDTTPR